ncbi:hypothetical protein [Streptomyces sp. NPDC048639]|uniref:hypothetical protein n=1 Tax=Streptomyces sp. NPDC048639 TaxID=3365581 RepID=UPI00371C10B0
MTDQTWNLHLRNRPLACHRTNGLRRHAERPPAAPVLHIHREQTHHPAEACLPLDHHRHTHQQTRQEAS